MRTIYGIGTLAVQKAYKKAAVESLRFGVSHATNHYFQQGTASGISYVAENIFGMGSKGADEIARGSSKAIAFFNKPGKFFGAKAAQYADKNFYNILTLSSLAGSPRNLPVPIYSATNSSRTSSLLPSSPLSSGLPTIKGTIEASFSTNASYYKVTSSLTP